jgi:hypothetical protein
MGMNVNESNNAAFSTWDRPFSSAEQYFREIRDFLSASAEGSF